ncbi:benzoate 4-monooxygenase cytochrome P450 [Arthroderma uncinatum]|uniref:benzoate 4-monooxygenase cytochrome P450 n=1 Tax=Arthroderma uncinatum TaxID=74035 RepID=UPI00144ACB8F|nr:benzoate 4-monooxygenase cytochrome P450 [Arthroderma uncinatum]KAF3480223.1 benzoate 4-monooxygenase cytochrome P450 [Arthroderma uncinatum]
MEKHGFRRRVMEYAFSDSALRSSEDFIIENVQIFCEELSNTAATPSKWGTPQDMNSWSTYLNYDIMGDLTFSTKFNCMRSEEHRYVPAIMITGTEFLYNFGYLPFVRFVRPLLGSKLLEILGGKLARDGKRYVEYAARQMVLRLEDTEKNDADFPRKDLMHYLINAEDPQTGQGLSPTELAAESSLLMAAGSDTTSTALSGTFFYLLHSPECLEKATIEVRSMFNSIEEIRGGSSLGSLVYLRACIDETLRLSPPVTTNLMVEVLPGGLAVDGNHFPEGTTLGVSPYVVHHNAQYYPDPYVYRPERWISRDKHCSVLTDDQKSTVESVANARSAFFAFSAGPHGCLGKNLAYLELIITLAMLLFKFDIRIPQDKELREPSGEGMSGNKHPGRRRRDEYQLVEHFIPIKKGPMVQFRDARWELID